MWMTWRAMSGWPYTEGLFQGVVAGPVGDRILSRIATCLVERVFKQNEVIARQGVANDQLFMLFMKHGRGRIIREVTAEAASAAMYEAGGRPARGSPPRHPHTF